MNNRQIEVQKEQAACEEKVISRLTQIYEQARKDCEGKIRALSMRTDMENLKSIVWQKQYQEALKKQLDSVLNTLNSEEFACITDYLTKSYENGFWGTLYDLQGQGIPLVFPIDQEQAVRALQVDSKLSQGYYKRLGEDTGRLKKAIQTELSRGISNGESWNRMAALIAAGMNSPFRKSYNNAIRIARTEGHRVQNEAAFHCQEKAKAKGADVVKQWDSTLDSRTRPHHVELNGQIRELEDPFEVAGHKAMYPGAFGVPEEDIHCRCCLVQRARWALEGEESYTKWDGDKNTLVSIKAADYNDFKEKVQGHLLKMQFPDDVYKIRGLTPEIKDELERALLKLKSEYDIRLNSIFVEKSTNFKRGDIFVVGYHDGVMDMVINQDADFEKIKRQIPMNYAKGLFAGKALEDYIAHEMAHVMLYQDCRSDNEYLAKYQQIESLYPYLAGVSEYADKKQSGNEALAESFVRVRNGEEVSPMVKILVDSYFGGFKR